MEIDFAVKNVKHRIAVKFARATLPGAKKPYTLRAAHQQELDIRDVAAKAAEYNIGVSPRVIEKGLSAGLALIGYLVSDGFKVKTPLFTVKARIPGEYNGTETCLPKDIHPKPHLLPSEQFRAYFEKRVGVEFDGRQNRDGLIAKAGDEATGLINETATIGALLTIKGRGLKIRADEAHRDEAGLFFEDSNGRAVKAEIIAVNKRLTLKVVVPGDLTGGTAYSLRIVTQATERQGGTLLQDPRIIRSWFTLLAKR